MENLFGEKGKEQGDGQYPNELPLDQRSDNEQKDHKRGRQRKLIVLLLQQKGTEDF